MAGRRTEWKSILLASLSRGGSVGAAEQYELFGDTGWHPWPDHPRRARGGKHDPKACALKSALGCRCGTDTAGEDEIPAQ
ncbi:hypothetical protein N658DRAFT_494626 [Parathielavia hyrcaniae]|uniref:Uncharacterized protein n=1 Tax=Parathielavia hyrcaniae TaxID=113614 RepID=A0AAN6Q9R8_9PEZI|nr:hypothetical protein N658DRAFT_494626 [Parathielavia hyrcaniae]